MHGNVWEWVEDCYKDYTEAPSGGTSVPDYSGCHRVLRGGSWIDHPELIRSINRKHEVQTGFRLNQIGFRLARTFPP
jgi:formylglycine-generating enzyme required for sulfatase activity